MSQAFVATVTRNTVLSLAVFAFVCSFAACRGDSYIATRIKGAKMQPFTEVDTTLPAVERGAVLFKRYGCQLCHGANGAQGIKNPNSQTGGEIASLTRVAEGYSKSELRKKILNGVKEIQRADPKGETPPFRMPGWTGRISKQNLNALVEYLFSLMPESEGDDW